MELHQKKRNEIVEVLESLSTRTSWLQVLQLYSRVAVISRMERTVFLSHLLNIYFCQTSKQAEKVQASTLFITQRGKRKQETQALLKPIMQANVS
jgi:hypothetical protein